MEKVYNSPIGPVKVVVESGLVVEVGILKRASKTQKTESSTPRLDAKNSQVMNHCMDQLKEYFAGRRKKFDLPLDQQGTKFQNKVWRQLQAIPWGSQKTYQEVAVSLRNKNAMRAVGSACGKNRHLIVVPCHRVLAKGGGLGGFAAGLEVKRSLLKLEGMD